MVVLNTRGLVLDCANMAFSELCRQIVFISIVLLRS